MELTSLNKILDMAICSLNTNGLLKGIVWFDGISTLVGYFCQILFVHIYMKYIWFGLFWFGFMAYQSLLVIQCQILFLHIYMKYIWFGLVWWHINHCWLFTANPVCTYIYEIYMIWFGLVWWHINHCWLFNAKSCLYIYIKYIICKYIL